MAIKAVTETSRYFVEFEVSDTLKSRIEDASSEVEKALNDEFFSRDTPRNLVLTALLESPQVQKALRKEVERAVYNVLINRVKTLRDVIENREEDVRSLQNEIDELLTVASQYETN